MHPVFETSHIGAAGGASETLQDRVARAARETSTRVMAGTIPRTADAAIAARDALSLIREHGTLGQPLLAELDRRLQGVAA